MVNKGRRLRYRIACGWLSWGRRKHSDARQTWTAATTLVTYSKKPTTSQYFLVLQDASEQSYCKNGTTQAFYFF